MNIGVKLNRLNQEDFIWIIYAFIVLAALYSNNLERDYYTKHEKKAFYKQKAINVTILVIAFFIYLYFVIIITDDLNHMEKNFQNKDYLINLARLVGAILFLVGGAIQVVIEAIQSEPDEIGFI